MTIEILEKYYGMSANISAIEEEIQTLYSPLKSPVSNGAHSTTPSDPTGRSAMRIIALKEKLEAEKARLLDEREEIEKWLSTCDDTEIASIIRWHYILGLNWKRTNAMVYGFPDYFYARRKVITYFDKMSKRSNSN